MMPQVASPEHELAVTDLAPHENGSSPPPSRPDDVATVETKTEDVLVQHQTNGHATPDAPPKTNGHAQNDSNGDIDDGVQGQDEPPAKRRRTRDTTPPPLSNKPKPESPPWKRIDADGPTSFKENGRRKSGRINMVPLEHQPQGKKRMTRQSMTGAQGSPPRKHDQSVNGKPAKATAVTQKPRQASKASHVRSASNSTPSSSQKKPASDSRRVSSRSTRRRTPSPPAAGTRHSTRPRRTSRLADGSDAHTTPGQDSKYVSHEGLGRSPRIKLRVGRSGVIPLVHPDQVRKRPKIGTSFEDFWGRGWDIPVEDGGLQASEDGPPYTDDVARKDAKIILRIEDEVEPGGLLSQERCSLFIPEGVEEPPRQWARQDHMTKAMTNFRKLLVGEQQRHRATAKRLAEACRDEWIRRQPRSVEELEAEAREKWIFRYRVVAKAMFGTWENVRAQVNRQRLEQWEAEEQKRVKAALNQAVSLSEQKLQARHAGLESEAPSDEDGFDDLSDEATGLENEGDDSPLGSGSGDGDDEDEDSDNMSSSDDDEMDDQKDVADEGLTQEQLREKYAHIPDLKPSAQSESMAPSVSGDAADDDKMDETNDTSDESVDMDDDLGSSDMDSDGRDEDGEDGSEEDESDSGGETRGLLGMFFGKSELQQMKSEESDATPQVLDDGTVLLDAELQESQPEVVAADGEDALDEDDDDAVSLVRHPDSIDGDEGQTEAPETHASPTTQEDTASAPANADSIASERIETMQHANGVDPHHPQEISTKSNNEEDVPMTDAASSSHDQPAPRGTADTTVEKPLSPETDPITNHVASERSQSPPTSETKPSEMDVSLSGDMVVAKSGASRSASPPTSPSHKTEIPFLLRGTLREYQHHGLDWLAGLYANNTNGILADEMGLGKTIQTIALLAHLACHHEVWGPHLVIVPTSVMLNWEMEFKKWCPGFKILAYYGSQEERKRKRQGWNNDDVWNVCITSYQLVLQDQQVFKRRRWHYMILDEAHNIKNFKSQRWQTLLGFNTQARLLLTGTPLQNNLTELWSLLFFLMPAENGVGGFADLQEFHDWFHKPESQILESGRDQLDEEAKAIISKLHKVLRPYLLRRLKADVEKQMPGKYEHVEFCRLSKRQRELYDGFLSRNDTKATLASGNYLSIINCLMQLRKVCNHPDLFVDRPIMTSFRMKKSIAAEYDVVDQTMRRSFLAVKPMSTVNLGFLNLVPTQHEHLSSTAADRVAQLSSHRALMDLREAQKVRAQAAYTNLDPSTVESNIAYLESASRWGRFEELQHCVYLNALRRQQRPVYGNNLVELLTIDAHKRTYKQRPKVPRQILAWFESESTLLRAMTPTLDQRADSFKTTIEKFAFATPAVVTRDLEQFVLGRRGVEAFTDADMKLSAPVRWAPFMPKQAPLDPWHESRMRSTIQFPDRRLLQFDCGKLQILDKLLRKLQAGGHRALIFTQMTKVLDILEQFLNIHGHKYLRLDGATKVEQRQILTDRFNNDPRILCFILSTRSGGLGINLTGADTVIFYDQDWNPAMDKQCQDRCHRIGQTRDVHIYRLISEHTIEANILRKASQKQMLDDVVIQEGEFTTDYFNRVSVRDVLGGKIDSTSEGVSAADAALDRVLGGPSTDDQRVVGRVLEQAEDREDVTAARIAEREIEADEADFTEKPSGAASAASTTRQGTPMAKSVLEGGLLDPADTIAEDENAERNAWGERIHTIDEYMMGTMAEQLKHTKLELPKDKKKSKKKGKDTRKR